MDSSYRSKAVALIHGVREAIDDDPEELDDTLDFISDSFLQLPAYYHEVVRINSVIASKAGHYDGDEMRGFDAERRHAHVNAAGAINKLNRIAKLYLKEPLFVFPEIGDRELEAGNVFERDPVKAERADKDREMAVPKIFNLCSHSPKPRPSDAKPRSERSLLTGRPS